MREFKGQTVNGEAALFGVTWEKIQAECAQYPRWTLIVEALTDKKLTSIQQMKYFHAVVIKTYAEDSGLSEWTAEIELKRGPNREYFVRPLEDSYAKRGRIFFECQNAHCNTIQVLPRRTAKNQYLCPTCGKPKIEPIFLLSKTELSTADFGSVLENSWDFLDSINCHVPPPDPEWRKNQEKNNG